MHHLYVALFFLFTLALRADHEVVPVSFDEEEIAWIKANPVIRVGVDKENRPFDFMLDDEKYGGIASSYLEIISKQTGIHFKIVAREEWNTLLDDIQEGEVDVIASIVPTIERMEYMLFSASYATFPTVIFSRQDDPFISGMRSLLGLTVAVESGFYTQDLLSREYPDIKLAYYPDRRSALEAVATRKADAYVGNLAAGSYVIRSQNLANLQVSAPTTFGWTNLSFGVREDMPILVSILDKVMHGVGPIERNKVEQEWIAVRYDKVWNWRLFCIWLSALTGLVLFFLFWNIILRRHINRRKEAEKLLEIAKEQAEQANIKKGEFLGMAAHDLKNPLAGIASMSGILMEGLTDKGALQIDDCEVRDMLTLINESATTMLVLINELLDLEKLDSELHHFAREQVDLVEVVKRVSNSYQLPAANKEIELKVTFPEECVVLANRQRMVQCFDNLVSNAIKFSPSGKKVYIVLTKEKRDEKAVAVFSVKDEGPGLTEADHQKLFQRFARLSAKPTGEEFSSGLGLSIVKSLVEKHGGHIWCESKPGEGACFIIEIPAS